MKKDKTIEEKLSSLEIPIDAKNAIQCFVENMHYLRKEFFKDHATLPTKFISKQTGLTNNQLWHLDNNLSGTIPMFLSLLYFYHKHGIRLNEMFSSDIQPNNPGIEQLKEQLNKMDEFLNE